MMRSLTMTVVEGRRKRRKSINPKDNEIAFLIHECMTQFRRRITILSSARKIFSIQILPKVTFS